jgi:hypothetical protein
MTVRLSDLHAGHTLSPGRFLVIICVKDGVDLIAIVVLEELSLLKIEVISQGIEPAIIRVVA